MQLSVQIFEMMFAMGWKVSTLKVTISDKLFLAGLSDIILDA